MKKLFILSALLISQLFFAQDVTKELTRFTEVKIYDRISAELVPSNENKIEITGSRSNEVEVLQKNDELKVRMPLTKLLKGENIIAKIYYAAILDEIEVFEGSDITSLQPVRAKDLEITAKEGSEIRLEIEADELDVNIATGAMVTLTGNVSGEMEAELKTGGVLNAKGLKTRRTEVSISAGGEADVNATDFVKARTRAGGTISIYGKPAKIDQQTFAGGTIKQK